MRFPEDAGAAPRWQEALDRARAIATERGLRADLHVFLDVPRDTPYEEPADDSADGLWVLLRHQPVRRLGDVSFLLGQLRNAHALRPRLVFPAEIRDAVVAAVSGVLA